MSETKLDDDDFSPELPIFDLDIYYSRVEKIMTKAERCLEKLIKEYKNCAIVLDIDGTAFNLSYISKYKGRPALKPVLKFYKLAIEKSVDVYFITARDQLALKDTKLNLSYAGYDTYKDVYFQIPNIDYVSSKTQHRKLIEESGKKIIINVGDHDEDLVGGYSVETFRLPRREEVFLKKEEKEEEDEFKILQSQIVEFCKMEEKDRKDNPIQEPMFDLQECF